MLSTLKKSVKIFFIFYVVIYSFVWLISPTVVRHFLGDYLKQYQLVLSDNSTIRYNPFLSHLSISDINIHKEANDSPVFSLSSLELEVRFYQLFLEQVFVSEFTIDGLYIKIARIAENIEVAGVALPLEENAETEGTDTASAETEVAAQDEKVEFPYKLELPELMLTNSTIELLVDNHPHKVKLKSFVITDFGATLASQSLMLSIDSEVNESTLSLDVGADLDKGDGKVVVDLALSKIKLQRFKHFLPEDIAKFEGLVSYKASHVIDLKQADISVTLNDLSLAIDEVLIANNDMHIGFSQQLLTSKTLAILLKPEGLPVAEGKLAFELNNFFSYAQESSAVIGSFEQLALNDINLYQEDNLNKVNIADIDLKNVTFSKDTTTELPPLAEFSLLNVNQIVASQQGLSVNGINLAGLAIDVQLSNDKQLLNMVELSQKTPENDDSAPTSAEPAVAEEAAIPQSEDKSSDFLLSLNKIMLTDDAHIHFTDKSVQPAYERHITLTTLNSGPFDTKAPETQSLFELIGESEKYANFAFTGFVQPFLAEPVYHLNGAFKEISLPGISPYIKEALKYEIQSGQLDLGLDVTLTGTDIGGDADVLLRGIELTAADDHEVGSVMDQTSMPFNIALGMLKDGDGNVELNLPLSGDTSNPSFGMSGLMTLLIKQATMSAAKDYLMTTFVPYASVVSIAISAGEYALKVRFNDLHFSEGTSELEDGHQEFLTQFSALMKDKPDVQVKLCAISTPADIGKTPEEVLNDEDNINALKELSTKRVHAFKDFMVEEQEIESSRLLFCTPQVDSDEEAKPAITFVT